MASWTFRHPGDGIIPAPFTRQTASSVIPEDPLELNALVEPEVPPTRPALQDASHRVNLAPDLPRIRAKPSSKRFQAAAKYADEMLDKMIAEGSIPGVGPASGVQAPVAPTPAVPFSAFDALLASSQRLAAESNKTTASAGSGGGATTTSKKRKAETPTSLDDEIAAYKQDLRDIEVHNIPIDLDCNQARRLVNKVLDSGIFKKGEFCDAIGNSNQAVNRFFALSGPHKGSQSEVYENAWSWFKQREVAGLKMPDVKKRQAAEAKAAAEAAGGDAGPAAKKTKTGTAAAASVSTLDKIKDISLWGQETDSVQVFDSANEIRKKINAHLKTPGLTQAQFCRDLYAQLQAPTCKAIQTKQLTDFRSKKGPLSGITSSVFYSAYVLFEKMRLANGKPKSKHRLNMEKAHPGGLDRSRDGSHCGYWLGPGETVTIDSCGVPQFHRR